MHYVIGDVHGCFYELDKLIRKIEREDDRAEFVLIGDVIDRGKDTAAVLKWCMEHVTSNGNYQMILGNHELLFLDWCNKEWFPYCRGEKTAYMHAPYKTDVVLKEAAMLTEQKVAEIYEFLRKLPVVKEKEVISPDGKQKYVIAHAWAKKEEMDAIRRGEYQAKEFWRTFLTDRAGVKADAAYDPQGTEILIHGHTPTTDEELYTQGGVPGRIVYRMHAVNIDCGMCYGKMNFELPSNLAAICLENLKEYYAYTLEEWYRTMQFDLKREDVAEGLTLNSEGPDTAVELKQEETEYVRQAVFTYKRKYHYSRPDMMRLKLVRQINGA